MQVGQTKTITLNAADAYGVYNDKAVVPVDKKKVPPEAKAGSVLTTSDGQLVRILALTEDKAIIDFNHPLAGQGLTFNMKILGVERSEKPISQSEEPLLLKRNCSFTCLMAVVMECSYNNPEDMCQAMRVHFHRPVALFAA